MNKKLLTLTRILLGWFFFYAGITKVLDPSWSAASYLENAQTFSQFYDFFLQPDILPIIDFVNAWGLTLLGASLLLGLFVRYSASLGVVLMILYYLPSLNFPYVGEHALLVDEHIIYALILMLFVVTNAGMHIGFDRVLSRRRRRQTYSE